MFYLANQSLNSNYEWTLIKGPSEDQQIIPEIQEQPKTQRVTSARFKPSMIIDTQNPNHQNELSQNSGPHMKNNNLINYSTSSLPRLGTSSIKKQGGPPQTIETSEATLELSVPAPKNKSNIATNAGMAGPPRSARYRPHGYRPPPTRKTSPNSRKSSVDSVNRFPGRTKIQVLSNK